MRKFVFSLLSCLAIVSCNSGSNDTLKYTPVENFKGEVRKVVTYSYESDIQKNKKIAEYGAPIPDEIISYNKYGSQEASIEISLPDDDEPNICVVRVDSVKYDKKGNVVAQKRHVIFTSPEEVINYANPALILSSNNSFAIHVNTKYEVNEENNKRIEKKITNEFVDIDKFNALPVYMQSIIEERFFWGDTKQILVSGTLPSDTTTVIYEFGGKNIVREIEEVGTTRSEIRRKYDGDNKIEEIRISGADSIRTTFVYKNGVLSEEHIGDAITRYDEKGREIAKIDGHNLSITTYKDTTKLSTEHFENYTTGNFVSFKRYSKEGLVLFSAILNLGEEDLYVDDAVLLFENFRDGIIDEYKLREEMESIVYKIDESNFNSLKKTNYSNYDSHGNPLKIVQTTTQMYNNYSFFRKNDYTRYYTTKRVLKSDSKDIKEREIEYYN